jgi:hypothetical protein
MVQLKDSICFQMSPNGFLEIWTMDPPSPKVYLSDQFHSLSTPTRLVWSLTICLGVFFLEVGQFIWGRWLENYPQEDLAKFGYKLERHWPVVIDFFNNCMILKFQNIMTYLDKPIIIQVGCQFLDTNTYIWGKFYK